MASLCCMKRLAQGVSYARKVAVYSQSAYLHSAVPSKSFSSSNCKLLFSFNQEHNKDPLRVQKRYAGHAKWQNIKSTKESKDQQRANLFSKISMSIKMALKDGSANPVSNQKLAEALELAKKNNMPKSTINSVIENCQKTMVNAKEAWFEYQGPGGLSLLIQLFTDNPKRPKGFVNGIAKKYGFRENKQQGGVRHMFTERGVIITDGKLEEKPISFSEAEDHAIEVGAEEVELVDGALHFLCESTELNTVLSGLRKLGYTIESSEVVFIPNNPITLDDDKMESLIACVTKLEDLEDVVKVHVNAA